MKAQSTFVARFPLNYFDRSVPKSAHLEFLRAIDVLKRTRHETVLSKPEEVRRIDPPWEPLQMYPAATLVRPKRMLKDPIYFPLASPLSWKISRPAQGNLEFGELPLRSSARNYVVRKIRFSRLPDLLLQDIPSIGPLRSGVSLSMWTRTIINALKIVYSRFTSEDYIFFSSISIISRPTATRNNYDKKSQS